MRDGAGDDELAEDRRRIVQSIGTVSREVRDVSVEHRDPARRLVAEVTDGSRRDSRDVGDSVGCDDSSARSAEGRVAEDERGDERPCVRVGRQSRRRARAKLARASVQARAMRGGEGVAGVERRAINGGHGSLSIGDGSVHARARNYSGGGG